MHMHNLDWGGGGPKGYSSVTLSWHTCSPPRHRFLWWAAKRKRRWKKWICCGKSQKQQNEIIWKRHAGVSGRLFTIRSQMVITVFEMKQLEVQRTRIWCLQIRSSVHSCHACYNYEINVPLATGFDTSCFPTAATLHVKISWNWGRGDEWGAIVVIGITVWW